MKKQQKQLLTGIEHPTLSFIKNQIIPYEQLTNDQNYRYYEEYKKLMHTAFCIHKKIKQLIDRKVAIQGKLNQEQNALRNKKNDTNKSQSHQNQPKRHRRTNDQIQKNYQCHFQKCQKSYGTQGSLQQHIRLKHGNQVAGNKGSETHKQPDVC